MVLSQRGVLPLRILKDDLGIMKLVVNADPLNCRSVRT